MHVFSGYWVVGAIGLRLLLALAGSATGPLALPKPRLAWVRPGRNPLFAWMAALLMGGMAVAGLSGIIADFVPFLEDLHEGLAEGSLWLVLAHAAIIAWIFQGRRILRLLGGARQVAVRIEKQCQPRLSLLHHLSHHGSHGGRASRQDGARHKAGGGLGQCQALHRCGQGGGTL
jgi:hypothetical protein